MISFILLALAAVAAGGSPPEGGYGRVSFTQPTDGDIIPGRRVHVSAAVSGLDLGSDCLIRYRVTYCSRPPQDAGAYGAEGFSMDGVDR